MTKFLSIILASFILALPLSASAARQVPGTLPNTTPLQPVPVDSAPNVSHNIQNSPSTSGVGGNSVSNAGAPENINAPGAAGNSASQEETNTIAANKTGEYPTSVVIIILLALAVIGAGVWLIKRRKNAQAGKS